MSNIRAILFDLDGVLVDAEQWHTKAFQMAMEDYGYETGLTDGKGMTTKQRLDYLASHGRAPKNKDNIVKRKNDYMMELIDSNCNSDERVLAIIDIAKYLVDYIGVVTNCSKDSAMFILNKLKLIDSFNTIVTSDDVDGYVKPHPRPYLTGASSLGLKPQECLAIDDSDIGIISAVEARCHTLRINKFKDLTGNLIIEKLESMRITI